MNIFLLQKNYLCSQTHRYDREWIIGNPKYFEETKFTTAFDPRAGENDGVATSSSDPRSRSSSSSSTHTSDPRNRSSSSYTNPSSHADPRRDPRASSSSSNRNDPRMRSRFDPRSRGGGAVDPRSRSMDPRMMAGRGRGRGMTVPAWMTNQK